MFFERAANLDSYLKTTFFYDKDFPDILKIKPEEIICSSCTQNLNVSKKSHKGYILLSLVATCEVFTAVCMNKDCKEFRVPISYSGSSSGIINYSDKFFIGVELIVEYMALYSKNGLSFSTWIENKVVLNKLATKSQFYSDITGLSSYYGRLHEIFCKATDLIIFDEKTFCCCSSPRIIQMDGLVNSVKANRITKFAEPWIKNSIVDRASTNLGRQLERLDSSTHKIVCDIIISKTCSANVLKILRNSKNMAVKLLSFCFETNKRGHNILHESSIMFAKTLTKSVAAVNSLIPSTSVAIVLRFVFYITLYYVIILFILQSIIISIAE